MVARYSPVASWMYFSQLDGLDDVDGVYTLGWRLTDEQTDPWTSRFNQFKINHSLDQKKYLRIRLVGPASGVFSIFFHPVFASL